ncbi:MAG: MFS transporter [Verrucomicrobiota bacterium]
MNNRAAAVVATCITGAITGRVDDIMTAGHREYPPFVSYGIATLMSVSMLSLLATLPFKIKTLGAGLDSVGFLFMCTSFCYVLTGLFLSWISHHAGPRRVMLAMLVMCGLTAVLLPFATAMWQVYVLASGYMTAICLFWAAMEHASTGLHTHLTLIQSTACFCAAFSLGNALGQMTSSLLQSQTVAVPFFVSAGMTVLVLVLTWLTVSPEAGFRRSTPADIAAFPESSRQRLRRSLLAARIGLVATYGMYALVCFFLPRYLWEYRGFSKPLAGSLAAVTLVTMSVTFGLHGLGKRWPHQLWIVRICPLVAAIGALLTGLSPSVPVITLGAVVLGVAAASNYTHHLYYSLEEPGKRARNAGIHEATVGLAFMIPPALGGLATRFTNDPKTIFWSGAVFAGLVIIVQTLAMRYTRPTSTALPS